jgi:hypothetical protein
MTTIFIARLMQDVACRFAADFVDLDLTLNVTEFLVTVWSDGRAHLGEEAKKFVQIGLIILELFAF